MASGIQLSGLASGFDWKSFADRIIELERAPAARYAQEKARNDSERSELTSLGTRLSSLQSAVAGLEAVDLGLGRKISNLSSSAKVTASASSLTPLGTYKVQVSKVAVAHQLQGAEVVYPIVEGSLELRVSADATPKTITVSGDMSLQNIVAAINASDAGITAITDGERIVLTSQLTGEDNEILIDGEPGVAAALGLTSPVEETDPADAVFTINGLEFFSSDDILDEEDHGIVGLSITAPTTDMSEGEYETFKVSSESSGLRTKIEAFIEAYNSVASFISTKTAVTTSAGKTSSGPLAANREVQNWLRDLRSAIFGAPASGEIQNISSLGLDFSSSDDLIKVVDADKLEAALAKHSADVVKFFNLDSVGLASVVSEKLSSFVGEDGSAGLLKTKLDSYVSANSRLDDQIAALDRFLEQRRAQLEAGFIAMEAAQSKMSQIQTMLTNSFGQKK
jgi:flagellar hook-associated protein 2